MPKIQKCDDTACEYNRDRKCTSQTVIMPEGNGAICKSINKSAGKTFYSLPIGSIAFCIVKQCRYNRALECTTKNIHMCMHSGHTECGTFAGEQTRRQSPPARTEQDG
ncbi:MAG: DUF1540 domain-containing protein [Spirochaetes bacterium]|nr:DUF1540 domain-containing protein [Spirochaetota bacterium]